MARIFIQQGMVRSSVDIWVIEDRPNGIVAILHGDKFDEYDKNAAVQIEPSLSIPRFAFQGDNVAKILLKAIEDMGVKSDPDAKLEGTLEATRYHLEDMREMLKLQRRGEKG
jgi:hypothetical protein